MMRRALVLLLVISLLGTLAACAPKPTQPTTPDPTTPVAPTFPTKPIEILVPFDPGGAVDTTIRLLTQAAQPFIDANFVIVNRPGGGAVIGQTEVANATPDGYKLLASTSSLVSNTITKDVTYSIDSFEPIIMYCFDPEVLVVPASSPHKTLQDVIEAGKKQSLLHSTPGHSTSHHIAGLIFTEMTGCDFDYVHTTGGAAQVLQLGGGHVEVAMSIYGTVRSMVEQGLIRIIAIASEERVEYLPDVPTFIESGVDLIYGAWRGVAAPAGTPSEVVKILHEAFKKAYETQDFQEKMYNGGYPTEYNGPADFKRYMQNDYQDLILIKDILLAGK